MRAGLRAPSPRWPLPAGSPAPAFTARGAGVRSPVTATSLELGGRFSAVGRGARWSLSEMAGVSVSRYGHGRIHGGRARGSWVLLLPPAGFRSGCRGAPRPQRGPFAASPPAQARAAGAACDRDRLFFFLLPFQEDETEVPEEVKKAWVSDPWWGRPACVCPPDRGAGCVQAWVWGSGDTALRTCRLLARIPFPSVVRRCPCSSRGFLRLRPGSNSVSGCFLSLMLLECIVL